MTPAGKPDQVASPTSTVFKRKIDATPRAPASDGSAITGYVILFSNGSLEEAFPLYDVIRHGALRPDMYTITHHCEQCDRRRSQQSNFKEQVIEEEIKNVDIDASEVSSQLFKVLSVEVIRTNKIRYAKNGQDFPFGFKLDDQVHGQQKELSAHFITPDYPYTADETRMHSAGKDELRVVLDPDERVLTDLRLLLKTDKYIKRKRTSSLSAIEEQILQTKATLNREREKELAQRIQTAVGKAGLIINAADVPASSTDALGRVTEGFQELISRTYTQLKLLGGITYSEQQVAGAANPDSGLFGLFIPAVGVGERHDLSA